jgi:hypothetical protein
MIINPFDNEQEFTSSDKLITHLTQLAVDKNNVFRGYGKQSELFPNIIREKDWREQEIRLLHEFERYGLQYFSANNPIDFMSYAQHYGLPTRLLDFTYNPFIALYFSLFTPKGTNYTYEEDRIYYYMRYCSLNDQIHIRTLPYFDETLFRSASFAVQSNRMIYLLNRIIRGLKEEADEHDTGVKAIVNYFARIYYDDHPSKSVESLTENPNFKSFLDDEITKFEQKRILFVDANQCNQRIVMQQGLFMFPYTLDIKEHSHILKSNTVVIKIHKRIRDDLLDYLDTIGINAFRLMLSSNPGLRDRIQFYIDFPDYSAEELVQIYCKYAESEAYQLGTDAKVTLRQMAEQIIRNKDENFSNARLIRKVFERTRMKQAMRTSDNMISAEDIQAVFAESDMRALLDSVQVQRRIGFAG